MTKVRIYVKPGATVPSPQTKGAAAFDLHAAQEIYIGPKGTAIVPTGLFVEVPQMWQLNIYSRSGLASKGIIVANSPGIVDSDYRGEVGVILYNSSAMVFHAKPGDRIAQAQINPVYPVTFEPVEELAELTVTERGAGGFGSTG